MMHWQACVALSDAIGLGHLVRVRALAARMQMCVDRVLVWTDWSHDRVQALAPNLSIQCVDLNAGHWPGGPLPDGLVMDMPEPPLGLLDTTRTVPRKLLLGCRDARTDWADLTVNVAEGDDLVQPEPGWDDAIWRGARFAMLRSRFLSGRQRPYEPAGPILVAIGGTDGARLTLPVVQTLLAARECSAHRLILVCRSGHPDDVELAQLAAVQPRLERYLPSDEIAEWMERAALAVVAPGNLLFECLALKLPAVAIAQHDRQVRDFCRYPWLIPGEHLSRLPSMVQGLLQESPMAWTLYARAAAVGRSLPMLQRWIQAPLASRHSPTPRAESSS